jgi:hypothetical protein
MRLVLGIDKAGDDCGVKCLFGEAFEIENFHLFYGNFKALQNSIRFHWQNTEDFYKSFFYFFEYRMDALQKPRASLICKIIITCKE